MNLVWLIKKPLQGLCIDKGNKKYWTGSEFFVTVPVADV